MNDLDYVDRKVLDDIEVLEKNMLTASEWIGSTRWRVKPHYTCGSPADLPRSNAYRVAGQELRSYHLTLCGAYGDEKQAEAEQRGLAGISLAYVQRRCHWEVQDLLTGDFYEQPYNGRKRCKHTKVHPERLNRIVRRLMQSRSDKLIPFIDMRRPLLGESPHYGTRIGEATFKFLDEEVF